MTHDHTSPAADAATDAEATPFGRPYWEDRYAEPGFTWSGNPNPVLVTESTPLTPGTALDIGSGEGGDAIWLATQGWRVTGIDISQNALDKARGRAEASAPTAATRITWEQHDLAEWAPEPGSFDLVSSQFMHLPNPIRTNLFRALAAAVAPGGTLLIVGHDAADFAPDAHQHHSDMMFTAADVVAAIEGEHLRIEAAESRSRVGRRPDGTTGDVRDIVVVAVRPA
ncbi:bifunctional 2-polyprenyl-6-hydroxyphenol methylase/3-demethylubiquinol 3-O-methyltransferase UbiG [Glaciihabitans sp. dw_435]|uniref:class I SAM-dependent methyltransferase n=1 Tax=Glaciihabitans sp. dw_435 TaxID=2720081 RepID=UPI001BD69D36|nr:class I SAM-dependent methyltransferase [Glaciihabitans sp. dw_435]